MELFHLNKLSAQAIKLSYLEIPFEYKNSNFRQFSQH
jgi:hypothetical protein